MPVLKRRFALWTGTLVLLLASVSRAQLVVESDLGVLPFGTVNVMGDTASGANNADYYFISANPEGNWGNELVYQFQLNAPSLLDLTLNSTSGDPDFFLLSGLATVADAGKNVAIEDIDSVFLDFALPDTASFGLVPPGTYYLSIDAFSSFDPPPAMPASATFDLDITTSPVVPPATFVDLGPIAVANEPITVDSFGSEFDTLLGIFDSGGFLLDVSDDADGTFQSQLNIAAGLPAGEYFVGLGGFDTVYQDGFVVDPQPGSEFGNYTLNYPGGPITGALPAEEAAWFRLEVAVPEPSTWVLAAIGMMLLVGTARHAGVTAASNRH